MAKRPRRVPPAGHEPALRDAREDDLPALLEIYNDAVRTSPATFDLRPQTLGQRRKWFAEHGGEYPLIVAEERDLVIGYASLSEFRDKPGYSKSAEDSVYVHGDFRGKGVGTLPMKEILARAVKPGYHTIIAGIVPPNEASVSLHEGLGFEYAGNFREVWFQVFTVAGRGLLSTLSAGRDKEKLGASGIIAAGPKQDSSQSRFGSSTRKETPVVADAVAVIGYIASAVAAASTPPSPPQPSSLTGHLRRRARRHQVARPRATRSSRTSTAHAGEEEVTARGIEEIAR